MRFLLKATRGPTTKVCLASLRILVLCEALLMYFLYRPFEGEPLEIKPMLWHPISLSLDHPFFMPVSLELEILTVEFCSSDEWKIGLCEE